jgi:internalin A
MNNQLALARIKSAKATMQTQLYLHSSQIIYLPPEIGELNALEDLYLDKNEIPELPVEIGNLLNLKHLELHRNKIKKLPQEIGNLANLVYLEAHHNSLEAIPVEIGKLSHLECLILHNNEIKELPPEIGDLAELKELDLSSNGLTELPFSLNKLVNLKKLDLTNNPLPIPPEILRKIKEPAAILNFYKQLKEQETDRLYEAKLLIIGEGGAGKTTLAQKIQDQTYRLQEQEVSTEGIDVIQWLFPLGDDEEFRVNIWDFGGQEIYHATHQFFLTKRSLYILVADSRKEDTDFYYWLNVVELLSGNSPLLIIKNEKQDRKREINERQLRGEFTSLKEILATNLSDNRGLEEILTQIKHYVGTLPHVGTELPKTWVKVREALEQESQNHITLEQYLQICQNNGFTQRPDKLQLSGYLHDLGVCLHFQEDDLLVKTVILKPTWGTDAVYKVLDNTQVIQNQGKFTRNDLVNIWHEAKYADMHPELLRLMMNFKLCYEIPSRSGTYIAPQLLTPNQPEYDWNELENLLLRYEYEFMPKGILTRFMVEMHNWIENQTNVWKTGVVLQKDNARAEIVELYRYHKGEIRIRVSGKRKRDLLTTIRHELSKIHNSYERLKYKTQVPCNCSTCKGQQQPYFYTLERLHKFLDTSKPKIQCYESGEDVL